MKKNVAIIGTAGIPARYGGFETLAHHLVKNLGEFYNFKVYCDGTAYTKRERQNYWRQARLYYLPLKANGMQSIFYDIVSMLHALLVADVFVVLGVSGGIFLPFIKIFTNKKIIVNIDGLEWKRDKWNRLARWFLKLSESIAVKYSHHQIADNAKIREYVEQEYGRESHYIAYGADHCHPVTIEAEDYSKYPFLAEDYAFKVCRIEPENNVHKIIAAYSEMPGETLVVVGNWANSEYGKQLRNDYHRFNNIYLLDPIYEAATLNKLRSNCSLYVHGHSAGGTNPSLVEAMYLKLPVLAFDVGYNRATTRNQAVFFKDEKDLISKVSGLNAHKKEEIAGMMYAIASEQYVWQQIATQYSQLIDQPAVYQQKVDTNQEQLAPVHD